MNDYKLKFIELKLARKELMLKCLNDFYEMHYDLAADDDVEGFEGEQQFSKECYGVTHTMIENLKNDNFLDLDTSFKCNIANISIDHLREEDYEVWDRNFGVVGDKLQIQIQRIWGI